MQQKQHANLALVEELDTPSGRGLANCDKMSAGPREAGGHAASTAGMRSCTGRWGCWREREIEGEVGDTTDLVDEKSNEGAVWPAKPADTHTRPGRRVTAYQSEPCGAMVASKGTRDVTRRQGHRPDSGLLSLAAFLPRRQRDPPSAGDDRARAAPQSTHPSSPHRERGRSQGKQADGGQKETPAHPQLRLPPLPVPPGPRLTRRALLRKNWTREKRDQTFESFYYSANMCK